MIDWLTLGLELPEHLWASASDLVRQGSVVQKVDLRTGEVEWSAPCRESVRSDTHQVTIQVSAARVVVSGSPARSMGRPNNVFGSDCLIACARAHLRLAREHTGLALPGLSSWTVTRVDVTHNFDFGGPGEVRQALGYLRQFDGGRYKVDTRRGETVYWSPGTRLRSGKAYHKGPHLRMQVEKGLASATPEQVDMAERLLRLELKLGAQWWREWRSHHRQWDAELGHEFERYWGALIGKVEVAEMGELSEIQKVAPTPSQGLAAYRTWCLIKAIGHREASESMPRSTWFRHKKLLNDAGLQWGDLASGQVVQFRRKALILSDPVTSWADLERRAA